MLSVYSFRGRITIAALVPVEDDDLMKSRDPTGWGWEPHYVAHYVPPDDEPNPLFEYHILGNGFYTRFPHLLPILALATLSVAAALPQIRWRFSLRTLLIATTLVAVVLGLIAAFR